MITYRKVIEYGKNSTVSEYTNDLGLGMKY